MVTTFTRPPLSANEQKRAHYHQVAKAKKLVGDQVVALVKGQKPIDNPVEVEVIWFVKDRRRRDADSLGPFMKAILDGLVQAGILKDDNAEFVPRVVMSIERASESRIEIWVREIT